jgi:hypothetical protein
MPVGATACHSDVSERHCGQNRVAGKRHAPQFPQRWTRTSPWRSARQKGWSGPSTVGKSLTMDPCHR